MSSVGEFLEVQVPHGTRKSISVTDISPAPPHGVDSGGRLHLHTRTFCQWHPTLRVLVARTLKEDSREGGCVYSKNPERKPLPGQQKIPERNLPATLPQPSMVPLPKSGFPVLSQKR